MTFAWVSAAILECKMLTMFLSNILPLPHLRVKALPFSVVTASIDQ